MKKFIFIFLLTLLTSPAVFASKKWQWSTPTNIQPENIENIADKPLTIPQPENNEETSSSDDLDNLNQLLSFGENDFEKADINHNNYIDENEFLLFQKNNFSALTDETFKQLDLNQDEIISEEEITTYYQKQTGNDSQAMSEIAERFQKADLDGNNSLDKVELEHFLQESIYQNNKMIFNLFDTNQDGRISKREWEEITTMFNTFQTMN